jgi:MoaA/NifB/PqqE/SkfB family radical SAM enzyme
LIAFSKKNVPVNFVMNVGVMSFWSENSHHWWYSLQTETQHHLHVETTLKKFRYCFSSLFRHCFQNYFNVEFMLWICFGFVYLYIAFDKNVKPLSYFPSAFIFERKEGYIYSFIILCWQVNSDVKIPTDEKPKVFECLQTIIINHYLYFICK